jgi:hypothetical protein
MFVNPEVADLQNQIGTGPQAASAIGIARGESPGQVDPRLEGINPNVMSQLDRAEFSRGLTRDNPIAGGVGAVGLTLTDLLKATGAQQKIAGALMPHMGFDEEAIKQFTSPANENTSDAGFGQTMKNIGGTWGGNAQGMAEFIGKLGPLLEQLRGGRQEIQDPPPIAGMIRG